MTPNPREKISTSSRFVEALVSDLVPVRPAPRWPYTVGSWALASIAAVVLAIILSGGFRTSVPAELRAGRLGLELILGLSSGFTLILAGFEIGVPGSPRIGCKLAVAFISTATWLAFGSYGGVLTDSAGWPHAVIDVTTIRARCDLQVVALAIAPFTLAIILLRPRIVFAQVPATSFSAAGAGVLAAVAMQTACAYEPAHAFRYHFLPAALFAGAGAIIGAFGLPRR